MTTTAAPVTTTPVLAVDGVTKAFHLRSGPGELVGLVGENGSGKSTLMQVIVGLLARDGGAVALNGRLGYCPQQPLVWDKLTVAEHFELFAQAYQLEAATATASRDSLLEELGFAKYLDYRVEALSGGTRQKLNLALALMHEPQLLLLDEPYAGFDWETYLRFWEMAERRRQEGIHRGRTSLHPKATQASANPLKRAETPKFCRRARPGAGSRDARCRL
jgi:ABC-2 type transport system ATP-binding protein